MVPGNKLALTFVKSLDTMSFVVIDDYSRFPEIKIVHSTSAKAVIPKLDRIFAAYGEPQVVRSDNGPPLMVESLHNLLSISASSTERCLLCGPKPMEKWNVL